MFLKLERRPASKDIVKNKLHLVVINPYFKGQLVMEAEKLDKH
ncbi:MAG TPA: hypothetical protein VF540_05730 [Segetibacter sp.]